LPDEEDSPERASDIWRRGNPAIPVGRKPGPERAKDNSEWGYAVGN